MGFAELVGQVGLVRIRHKVLVVDEEHNGRHGDDRVFLVESGGGVIKLEPLRLAVGRRRVFRHRRLNDAVELAGAGDVLRTFFDRDGPFKDVDCGVSRFRGTCDEGCVGKEE